MFVSCSHFTCGLHSLKPCPLFHHVLFRWWGVVKRCFTESNLVASFVKSDVKLDPLSLRTSAGTPYLVNISTSASASYHVPAVCSAIVSETWWPCLPWSKRTSCLNWISGQWAPLYQWLLAWIARRSSGYYAGCLPTLPFEKVRWHTTHYHVYLFTSLCSPGQENSSPIKAVVFLPYWCPDMMPSSAIAITAGSSCFGSTNCFIFLPELWTDLQSTCFLCAYTSLPFSPLLLDCVKLFQRLHNPLSSFCATTTSPGVIHRSFIC